MNRQLSPAVRRLVLGGAFLAATILALLPQSPPVQAEAGLVVLAQAESKAAAESARNTARAVAREAAAAAKAAAADAALKAVEAEAAAEELDKEVTPSKSRKRGMRVNIDGLDRDYDSFDQFLDRDPALASMVLGIVFITFLTPILLLALIIWYKVRKNRMQNETMLKLAEKGMVAPGVAMQAIGTGQAATVIGASAVNAPLAEQARALRKQTAWSDLRKGVLLGTVGLGLTLYSLFDDRSPNWLGLVLLFVGIGYCVLWHFEDRQTSGSRVTTPTPSAGPGDMPN